jgi:VIT1/CCC1 family predicted Fe2+/Mn2+ transporter
MTDPSTQQIYIDNAINELTEHIVYGKLARREKNPGNRAALEKLSAQEKTHYEFWKMLAKEGSRSNTEPEIKPRGYTVASIAFLRFALGVTFITKFLESHEDDAVHKYQGLADAIPAQHKTRFAEIIEDEKSHEKALIAQLKEARVSYMGFIVLGLADAIVEITGVHAGFLGVTGSTLIAGVSGIIVGFAAAISMGSAAYLQAKQDTEKSAIVSAFATGFAYFFSVILLALPYFLIRTMITAFATSTSVGIILIAGFTFYGAVIFDRKFWHEFAEAAGLMLATAFATFIWGTIIGRIFNLKPTSF